MTFNVSVIIPSYDRYVRLVSCLGSVRASNGLPPSGPEIIVVTSTYSLAERQEIESLGAGIVALESPRSTSESRNLGAEGAQGAYLLFLDDDNEIAPDAIAHLVAAFERWPETVVAGPVMYYGDAPDRLWCSGVRRSRVLMKTTLTASSPERSERFRSEDFPNCFMVRRKDFRGVGGFDEIGFPQQWEEGDLARRLVRHTGGAVYGVSAARTWHFIDLDFVQRLHLRDAERAYLCARGRAMFTALYGDKLQWFAYLCISQWLFAAVYLAAILSLPRKQWKPLVDAYMRGLRVGLRDGRLARTKIERHPQIAGRAKPRA